MTILVIDVGTSGLRAAAVRPDASVAVELHRPLLPSSPEPGLVEFDASLMATTALELARAVLAEVGAVDAVGITNQRASSIVWDRATGEPVGPGIGWQDLRTVGTCLVLQAEGIHLAPNASATKLGYLLDTYDPDRSRDLCFGTVDTWLAWHLSEGAIHAIDATNAAVTGMLTGDAAGWHDKVLTALRVPAEILPQVVDTSQVLGPATALAGSPPITALVGDQQASLVGQGCVSPGMAKITFGTGGMLDLHLGPERPRFERQGDGGCFPIVAWRRDGVTAWGVEAIMLSAGT
jgi:glycerol kinase